MPLGQLHWRLGGIRLSPQKVGNDWPTGDHGRTQTRRVTRTASKRSGQMTQTRARQAWCAHSRSTECDVKTLDGAGTATMTESDAQSIASRHAQPTNTAVEQAAANPQLKEGPAASFTVSYVEPRAKTTLVAKNGMPWAAGKWSAKPAAPVPRVRTFLPPRVAVDAANSQRRRHGGLSPPTAPADALLAPASCRRIRFGWPGRSRCYHWLFSGSA